MQFHQGSRLKYFIDKSHLEVKDIADKSGIPRTTLYGMFEKAELLRSKVEAVLKVIKVDTARFFNSKDPTIDGNDFENENAQLKEIITLLRKQNELQAETIELLKKRK